MSVRTYRKHDLGMTLLEVMVALALLALLSIGLLTSFRLGEHTYGQLTRRVAGERDIVTAQRFLRQLLESAYPFRQSTSARSRAFGLEGTSSELVLTAPMPQGHGGKGNYRYQVLPVGLAGGSRNLILRWCLDRNGATAATCGAADNTHEELLVPNVEVVEWGYLEAQPEAPEAGVMTESEWSSSWSEKRRLPTLIRLHIGFASGDPRIWPDLVVSPRVTDDANCQFDVVAQSCRES